MRFLCERILKMGVKLYTWDNMQFIRFIKCATAKTTPPTYFGTILEKGKTLHTSIREIFRIAWTRVINPG